jgi:hypothetical protein
MHAFCCKCLIGDIHLVVALFYLSAFSQGLWDYITGRKWWHGITSLAERSRVTTYIPLCTGSTRWTQEGYGDSDNSIHPKCVGVVISYRRVKSHPSNHWLYTARAGQLWEKVEPCDRLRSPYPACWSCVTGHNQWLNERDFSRP